MFKTDVHLEVDMCEVIQSGALMLMMNPRQKGCVASIMCHVQLVVVAVRLRSSG